MSNSSTTPANKVAAFVVTLPKHTLIGAASAVALLISMILPWATISQVGISFSGFRVGYAHLAVILAAGSLVMQVLWQRKDSVREKQSWMRFAIPASGIASAAMVLIYLLRIGQFSGFGAWIGLICTVGVAIGATLPVFKAND